MDIATQIGRYFAVAADAAAPGEAAPVTTSGNTITPLIDGRRYFRVIRDLLEGLGTGPTVPNQFFYVTGWWLHLTTGPGALVPTDAETEPIFPGGGPTSPTKRPGDDQPAFLLEDDRPGPYPLMARLLAQKAQAGVDVRVMGWVNPLILFESVASHVETYWQMVVGTLFSIQDLRARTVGAGTTKPLARRVCALTVGHALGAMHLKMVVAHDGTKPWAFIGGIDFAASRVAGELHPGTELWHDMAVRVDGPAVQTFYDHYRNLWNQQLVEPARSQQFKVNTSTVNAVEPGTLPVPARALPAAGMGKHRVQIARTLPQFNFVNKIPPSGATPLPFAPNGAFEVTVAWRRAIANATDYIYIEDQAFWSHDVMDWINARVKAHPGVKVILLGGAQDPADPPRDSYLVEAINGHLLAGLSDAEQTRIGFFFRKGGVVVHAKVTIIDDHWLFVGSANCIRRSLYTDGELSVGCLDEDDVLAKEVRVALWGGHFGKAPADRASLSDLSRALGVWHLLWGANRPYPLPSALIERRALPLGAPPSPFDANDYALQDADSRHVW